MVSPGAMLDGTPIQDRDPYSVPSIRRNPVIADVFTQLNYMEKRGSGLRKMCELTQILPNFHVGKEPRYRTEAISFCTTFYNLNWSEKGRVSVENVASAVESSVERFGVNEESSVERFGVNEESSVERFGVNEESSVERFGVNEESSVEKFDVNVENADSSQKTVGRTAQKILDYVVADPSITAENLAGKIGVSKRAIEKNIKNLRELGVLIREGSDKSGYWRVIIS